MVLYVWALIVPKPQGQQNPLDQSQVFENKEDTTEKEKPSLPPSPSSVVKTKATETVSKMEVQKKSIDNDLLYLEFSNIGGNLDAVSIKEFDATLPVTNILSIHGLEQGVFELTDYGRDYVVYVYEDENQKIEKKYSLSEDDYIIRSNISIQNKSETSKVFDVGINKLILKMSNLNGNQNGQKNGNKRDQSLYEYSVYTDNKIIRKGSAFKFNEKENKIQDGVVEWFGFRDRYFCAIVKPLFSASGYSINRLNETTLKLALENKNINIPANGAVSFESLIYVGPQNIDTLKQYKQGFEQIVSFSGFGLFDVIAKFIYFLIHLLQRIIPNWGICIILISVIIYYSMYPLTARGMASMKKMQAIQPEVAKIKEKHGKNPQKMNTEVMDLYKKHKVNPIGGCFPILLQMPVFIGLYQVLWRSVSFKGASFLWIDDLSEPDRLFIMPFSLPFLGNEFNLLPVIMIAVMVFQQKLSAKNMVLTDPAQIAQQKMMQRIFPVFLGFIFYKFASGLTLYFTMFYIFSTLTQWKMSKEPQVV